MSGFTEICICEQCSIAGGKDSEVSKFMEMLGYTVGVLVKAIRDMKKRKQGNAAPALYMA